MNFKKTYHLHPAMRLLYNALQKERNLQLVLAIVLITAGVTVPYLYFRENSFISSVGMVALIVGIRLMYGILKKPKPEDERLWILLNETPRQIVWVYSIATRTMPFGFHLWDNGVMYFKLLDGDEISVNLPVRKLKMVSKFLNRLLPHASFGYSAERQTQFESDPKLLLK
ncbi:MAG: hypothetical protein R2825_06905 [Saprospiraceae bacterium]